MTEAYRLTELENATQQSAAARARYNAAKVGSRDWKKAAEELEFWSNKVAFLQAPAG